MRRASGEVALRNRGNALARRRGLASFQCNAAIGPCYRVERANLRHATVERIAARQCRSRTASPIFHPDDSPMTPMRPAEREPCDEMVFSDDHVVEGTKLRGSPAHDSVILGIR